MVHLSVVPVRPVERTPDDPLAQRPDGGSLREMQIRFAGKSTALSRGVGGWPDHGFAPSPQKLKKSVSQPCPRSCSAWASALPPSCGRGALGAGLHPWRHRLRPGNRRGPGSCPDRAGREGAKLGLIFLEMRRAAEHLARIVG